MYRNFHIIVLETTNYDSHQLRIIQEVLDYE